MSWRQYRKLYGGNTLPPPDENSDEDYAPLYTKTSVTKYKYQEFQLSSHSDTEHEAMNVSTEVDAPEILTKKKKKKKKKQTQKTKPVSDKSKKMSEEKDEIDILVNEVNAILGPPSSVVNVPVDNPKINGDNLMTVQAKYLYFLNELRKRFGPDEDEDAIRRRSRQSNQFKKAFIVPVDDYSSQFKKCGLSMSRYEAKKLNGQNFIYTFDHNKEYQKRHHTYLRLMKYAMANTLDWTLLEDYHKNLHVEGMLQMVDELFRAQEYTTANKVLEQIIAYLQYVAHPTFSLVNRNIRLPYKFEENRAFHIAVLKYLHLLTNRACHRTALELAKLLLNLDPTDPLAVLLIIDVIALRAREHQWLIDAVHYWSKERDANFMFNIQYSYAMARFHIAKNNEEDLLEADNLLQKAIIHFPLVTKEILECCHVNNARLKSHPLFTNEEFMVDEMRQLITIYAKFAYSKWREPSVMKWLLRNANDLADKYDRDANMKENCLEIAKKNKRLFQTLPKEVNRHLSIISSMLRHLVDAEMELPNLYQLLSADPFPPSDGIDRHGYRLHSDSNQGAGNSSIFELFSSIIPPRYDDLFPPDLAQNAGEFQNERNLREELLNLRQVFESDDDSSTE